MCAPSPPPPPDYTAAAQAQGAANVETAKVQGQLSNPNIIAPWGTQTVTWGDGTGGAGTFDQTAFDQAYNTYLGTGQQQVTGYNEWGQPIYGQSAPTGVRPVASDYYTAGSENMQPTVKISMSPEQQALYDQEQRIKSQIGALGESSIDRVANAMGTSFDTSQFPEISYGPGGSYSPTTGFGGQGTIQTGLPSAGGVNRTGPTGGTIQGQFGEVGDVSRGIDMSGAPGLRGSYDFSGAPGMPTANEATRQSIVNSILSRQEPMLAQGEQQARSDLIARGFREGTTGFETEMDRLARTRNDARMAADIAGGQEMERIFGMGMAGRQQGVNEAIAQGNFGNSARLQALNEALTKGNFANQAQQQAFTQAAARGQFANTAQQQAWNQALSKMQFENEAQRQQFEQGVASGTFANMAQQQQFQQALQQAGFFNQAQQQGFNQSLAASQFQNDARTRAVQEALMMRQLPLNELSALRSGSQVSMPQFQPFQGVQGIQPPPLFGATAEQGNYATDLYNADVGQRNSTMGTVGSLAGAAMMAFAI